MTTGSNCNINNEKGYTIIEALLVLSIWVVILSVVPIFTTTVKDKLMTNAVLHQFQEDIYFAQAWAISREVPVTFTYLATSNMYLIRESNGTTLIRRELPEDVEIKRWSMNEFRFSNKGMIRQFGSLYMEIKDQLYKITLHIGRGRIEIQKE